MAAAEVTAVLEKQERLLTVLSAYGGRFREQWKEWCCECRVQARFAHPSYPLGKVARCIQNLNREGFLLTVPIDYSSLSLSPKARAKTC